MTQTYYQKNKEIIKARNKLWKKNNRDKVLLNNKKYKLKHKEKIAAYEKERQKRPEVKEKLRKNTLNHYYRNRDKQLLVMKEWRSKNKDWLFKWRKDNLISKRIYQRKYYSVNPNNIIIHRLRTRLYFILNHYTKTGKIMSSRKYGIDYAKIIEHLKPFPEDLSKYHVDHIIPLSSFDLTKPEQIKIAFAPENHQWLLEFDNLSKHNKLL
jgi:hypothetical protein